jgi:hypothetical protein
VAQQRLIPLWIAFLQNQKCKNLINRGLHDLPHLSLGDVRIFRFTVACRTGLARMHILDWSIAESQRHKRLRLSRQSR